MGDQNKRVFRAKIAVRDLLLINLGTDARLDEPDRAIAEDEVAATRMPAAEAAQESIALGDALPIGLRLREDSD